MVIPPHGASRTKDMTKTKNWKESILKNAKSIPKLIHKIADVGAKSANRGSTSPGHFISLEARPPLAASRPSVNSILHLYGAWLVEAALIGVKVHGSVSTGELGNHSF